jgi:hypothetical protein
VIEIIPIYDQAFWTARVNLDGTDFILDFNWNGRLSMWLLDLKRSDDTLLVAGIGLTINRPLFERFRYIEGMPLGELMAVDVSERIAVPGYYDLGESAPEGTREGGGVLLLYYEALEGETSGGVV